MKVALTRNYRPVSGKRLRVPWEIWLFLLPGAVLLCVFLIVPFCLAIGYSFTSLRLISPLPVRFLGWDNYQTILQDALFHQAVLNNFLFAILVVPIQSCLALCMAVLVNQRLRGVRFFRTIYFAPLVTVLTVAATIWNLLYIPDSGFVNAFLGWLTLGHVHPDWLHDPHTALFAVMMVGLWQSAGFQMVIFLAGLQDIPQDFYEAAALDGAGALAQFRWITLPGLRNTIIFVVTMTTIFAFRLFDTVYIMTFGGPVGSTETMLLQIFRIGFDQQKIALGSAISVIFFLVVLVVSIIQRLFVREEGAWS